MSTQRVVSPGRKTRQTSRYQAVPQKILTTAVPPLQRIFENAFISGSLDQMLASLAGLGPEFFTPGTPTGDTAWGHRWLTDPMTIPGGVRTQHLSLVSVLDGVNALLDAGLSPTLSDKTSGFNLLHQLVCVLPYAVAPTSPGFAQEPGEYDALRATVSRLITAGVSPWAPVENAQSTAGVKYAGMSSLHLLAWTTPQYLESEPAIERCLTFFDTIRTHRPDPSEKQLRPAIDAMRCPRLRTYLEGWLLELETGADMTLPPSRRSARI